MMQNDYWQNYFKTRFVGNSFASVFAFKTVVIQSQN